RLPLPAGGRPYGWVVPKRKSTVASCEHCPCGRVSLSRAATWPTGNPLVVVMPIGTALAGGHRFAHKRPTGTLSYRCPLLQAAWLHVAAPAGALAVGGHHVGSLTVGASPIGALAESSRP
ncbi:hypothetical protein BHM03_00052921, partial [Ensete ventricosum]